MNHDAAGEQHQPESLAAQYNRELLEAKTEALKVLADLLRTSQDPAEARRIARAILSVKPIAPAQPKAAEPAPAEPTPISAHALGTLYLNTAALPVASPTDLPAELAHPLDLPITLTPTCEPPQPGGPASLRPLPHPLGTFRA
ncbi:MAG: hypothetical protein QM783_06505 [Phycisphaerales bacterium]